METMQYFGVADTHLCTDLLVGVVCCTIQYIAMHACTYVLSRWRKKAGPAENIRTVDVEKTNLIWTLSSVAAGRAQTCVRATNN